MLSPRADSALEGFILELREDERDAVLSEILDLAPGLDDGGGGRKRGDDLQVYWFPCLFGEWRGDNT